MKTAIELRLERASKIEEAKGLLHAEKFDEETYNKIMDEVRGLAAHIKRAEEMEALELEMKSSIDDKTHRELPGDDGKPAKKEVKQFSSIGEQLISVSRACNPYAPMRDERLMFFDDREQRLMPSGSSEGVPSDGGFLVQKDYAAELLRRSYATSELIGRTRRIPISGNSTGVKINGLVDNNRQTGSRFGGITVYWTEEAGLKLASKPKFRQIELNVHKLAALWYATDELLQDAAAITGVINEAFPEEFNWVMNEALLTGTGVGQPLGIFNSPALITVPIEQGQPAGTIYYENIKNMWSRLWARSRGNAVWLINQEVEPQLYDMGLMLGTGGTPVFMPPTGITGSMYSTLFGRPIIPIEHCSALGTVGDIVLADFSQYITIDKGGLDSASSIHVRFVYDETVFRFVYRFDGQPIWETVLTPAKGTLTYSPFVVLAAR